MKSKSVNFSASNAKCSVKFASVNENLLHAAFDNNDCLFTFWVNSEWSCERHTGLFAIRCVYSLMWMHLNIMSATLPPVDSCLQKAMLHHVTLLSIDAFVTYSTLNFFIDFQFLSCYSKICTNFSNNSFQNAWKSTLVQNFLTISQFS